MSKIFSKIIIHIILLFKIKLTIIFIFYFSNYMVCHGLTRVFFVTTSNYNKTTHKTLPDLIEYQENNKPWHRMMESGGDT